MRYAQSRNRVLFISVAFTQSLMYYQIKKEKEGREGEREEGRKERREARKESRQERQKEGSPKEGSRQDCSSRPFLFLILDPMPEAFLFHRL